MSDVTLSFVANDDGVMRSLNKQEAAIQASIARMNNQYAGITRKFTGAGAVGGFLGGLGIGSAFAVTNKLLDSYSRSSEYAAAQTAKLSREMDRAWSIASEVVVGPLVEIGAAAADSKLLQILASFGGVLGIGEASGIGLIQRDAEKMAKALDRAIPAMDKYKAAAAGMSAAFESELEASLAYETRNSPKAEQRRRAASLRARQRDDEIVVALNEGRILPEAAASMRRENDLRYVTELDDIAKAERDAADAYADAMQKQTDHIIDLARARDEAEKRTAENIELELASLDIGRLRNEGNDAAARYAQIELELRTRLLEVSRLENASEADKLRLRESATSLAESQIDEFDRQAREVRGGRGVEAGLASAFGVVRGSLVATARENPAALQRETNQILRKILDAVGDGAGTATFAP